jgi:hypothetical protein
LASNLPPRKPHLPRPIAADETSGILAGLNQGTRYTKARELSKRHTCSMSCRSLDILHVAAALILCSKFFASFDERQRKLAAVEGMTPDSAEYQITHVEPRGTLIHRSPAL